MTRLLVLGAALAFFAVLGFLTVATIHDHGLTAGSALSILILVFLFVGIVGALSNPPRR
jgi:membrane associated rhomboid family serine protease